MCPLSHLLANASSPEGRAGKPERIFCFSAQSKLVSPSGRDVAQRQRGHLPVDIASQICPNTCPLSHLLANASSPFGRAEKPERIFSFSAQTKLVSPFGRDVAQRQRGLLPADISSQICPNTNLLACCPLSHLLANASSPEGRAEKPERIFGFYRAVQLVSPFGRDVAQRQRGLLPADISSQICPNTNLLACCPLSHLLANASSPEGRAEKSERIFSFYAQSKLVSPSGRDVAQRQRGHLPVDIASQICPNTNLLACCPLGHLLANASSPEGRAEKRERIFCFSAQSKLVSHSGRDVAQRQRGLESADMAFQICPNTNLLACCPLSHLLANASSPEGRAEKSERIFSFYAQSKLVSPSGRDVAQRQRGLESADIASQICPNTNLLACCPLSHLLANASSPEGRAEKPVRIFSFYAQRQRGHCRLFFLADNFSIKKALRGVLFFYLFSWMCCRMLGCLRCCRCFPCFRCLLPHRSLRSVPNPHP